MYTLILPPDSIEFRHRIALVNRKVTAGVGDCRVGDHSLTIQESCDNRSLYPANEDRCERSDLG
jgi:hypothetical protein